MIITDMSLATNSTQTRDEVLAALNANAHEFPYIHNQTEAYCILAVKLHAGNLLHVENQTFKIIQAAVKNNVNVSYINLNILTKAQKRHFGIHHKAKNLNYEQLTLSLNDTPSSVLNIAQAFDLPLNQYYELCRIAINKHMSIFKYVKNPPRDIIEYVLSIDPDRFLPFIKKHDLELIELSIANGLENKNYINWNDLTADEIDYIKLL